MSNTSSEPTASFLDLIGHANISDERRQFLADAAESCVEETKSGKINLLCVCTHNSRRSQFSHFWSAYFAEKMGLSSVSAHSCGTEATECNPRTLQALSRAGVSVSTEGVNENPKSTCVFNGTEVVLYSKAFGEATLPDNSIVALMCCDDADQKCPIVPGAISRVALHYRDPKYADSTADESKAYDYANLTIAAEMQFFVSQIAKAIATKASE